MTVTSKRPYTPYALTLQFETSVVYRLIYSLRRILCYTHNLSLLLLSVNTSLSFLREKKFSHVALGAAEKPRALLTEEGRAVRASFYQSPTRSRLYVYILIYVYN